MRILVLAQSGAPLHGQSILVSEWVSWLRQQEHLQKGKVRIYHVNLSLSREHAEIGVFRFRKLLIVFTVAAQALWHRFAHGASVLYYVPAPGKIVPVLRDCLILSTIKWAFPRVCFHWLACGLGEYYENLPPSLLRTWVRLIFRRADVNIVPTSYGATDVRKLSDSPISIAPFTISDPVPGFDANLIADRRNRHAARLAMLEENAPSDASPADFHVLFMAHLTEDKGLFVTLAACQQLAEEPACRDGAIRITLNVAGAFIEGENETKLVNHLRSLNLEPIDEASAAAGLGIWENAARSLRIKFLGVVRGDRKAALMKDSDCLCFPTFYAAEAFPIVLLDAMAWGLPIITTTWRSIEEVLPPNGLRPVPPRDVDAVTSALRTAMVFPDFDTYRQWFTSRYAMEQVFSKWLDLLSQTK